MICVASLYKVVRACSIVDFPVACVVWSLFAFHDGEHYSRKSVAERVTFVPWKVGSTHGILILSTFIIDEEMEALGVAILIKLLFFSIATLSVHVFLVCMCVCLLTSS